jgi:hypothetical protein
MVKMQKNRANSSSITITSCTKRNRIKIRGRMEKASRKSEKAQELDSG